MVNCKSPILLRKQRKQQHSTNSCGKGAMRSWCCFVALIAGSGQYVQRKVRWHCYKWHTQLVGSGCQFEDQLSPSFTPSLPLFLDIISSHSCGIILACLLPTDFKMHPKVRLEARRALWPSRWSIGQRQPKRSSKIWLNGGKERQREKGRTVVAQRKLSLNCCENRLSRVERQAVFWLDRSNVRLCAEHPASINSSESFHSIGGQLGLTELTPCFPSSYNPSYPLFPSCQSVSPQITPLTELSDYTDFSWPSTRPSLPRHFDTVSPSTSVTDWTMRHMTLVQMGDKNEIRHVIQCEGVRGNDCSSLHRHTHTRARTYSLHPHPDQC